MSGRVAGRRALDAGDGPELVAEHLVAVVVVLAEGDGSTRDVSVGRGQLEGFEARDQGALVRGGRSRGRCGVVRDGGGRIGFGLGRHGGLAGNESVARLLSGRRFGGRRDGGRRVGVRLGRVRGRGVGRCGITGCDVERRRRQRLLQDGAEPELGRLPHQFERPVTVLDARELHHDRIALTGDLGLGHADAVDALTDDLDRLADGLAVGFLGGLEHDRDAALEVEAQERLVAGRRTCRPGRRPRAGR